MESQVRGMRPVGRGRESAKRRNGTRNVTARPGTNKVFVVEGRQVQSASHRARLPGAGGSVRALRNRSGFAKAGPTGYPGQRGRAQKAESTWELVKVNEARRSGGGEVRGKPVQG